MKRSFYLTILLLATASFNINVKEKKSVKKIKSDNSIQTPYILIVNYNLNEMTVNEHAELGKNVASNFTPEKIDGLIGKSFIENIEKGVYGWVYHFKTKNSADNYINSEFWLGIEAHPNLVNFTKDIFGVAPISSQSNCITIL